MIGCVLHRVVLCLLVALALSASGVAGQSSHFPSPHQLWTSREYVNFYFGHYNGNRALPHLRSETTARLFNRLVDRDNVRELLGSSASMDEKRSEIAVILSTMGEIRAAYAYALHVGEPLEEELTRIRSFMLYLIDLAIGLGQGRADPAASAWRTTLWNVVESMSERDVYSAEQAATLSNALADHYGQLSLILTDADRLRLRSRIEALAVAEKDPAARAAHLRLIKALSE
jgi:hypothetical protein